MLSYVAIDLSMSMIIFSKNITSNNFVLLTAFFVFFDNGLIVLTLLDGGPPTVKKNEITYEITGFPGNNSFILTLGGVNL